MSHLDGPYTAGPDVATFCNRATAALVRGMRSRTSAYRKDNRWVIATGQAGAALHYLTMERAVTANEHALADALIKCAESELDPRLIHWLQSLAAASRPDKPIPMPTTMANRSTRQADSAMRHTVSTSVQVIEKDSETGRFISAGTRLADGG
jgi:hypothetical protein